MHEYFNGLFKRKTKIKDKTTSWTFEEFSPEAAFTKQKLAT